MKPIKYLAAALALSVTLNLGLYAEDPIVQFQTGADHQLSPEQVKILKDNVIVKGYAVSFQPLADEQGNAKGDKYVMAKTLPADADAATRLEQLALLGTAMMEYPKDQELSKAVEARAIEYLTKGMPKEAGDPENGTDIAEGYRMIAVLMQVAEVPRIDFKSETNPFVPWADLMIFASTNDLHHYAYPGHKWKLGKDGLPVLYMPNGKQRWARLKAAGIDTPDHHMSASWSYTKDGFVKAKDGKAKVDPL